MFEPPPGEQLLGVELHDRGTTMNSRSLRTAKVSATPLLAAVATTVLTLSAVAPAQATANHQVSPADPSATVVGTVKLPNGQAATGAKVYVFLDGVSAAANPSTRVGSTVQNPLLATTTTDSTGHYSLTMPKATVATTRAADVNGGYVNLQVTSVGRNGDIGSHEVIRQLDAGQRLETARAAASRQGLKHQPAANVTLIKSANGVAPDCIVNPPIKPPTTPLDTGVSPTSPSVKPMNTSTLLKTWRGRTHMNSLRSDIDMSAEFSYGTTEDSSIEVAISGSSESGFASSGSVHLGHNRGTVVTSRIVSRDHRSVLGDFTYGKYRVKQMIGCGWRYYYQIRAIRWQDNLVKSGKGKYAGCPSGYTHRPFSRGETAHVWHGTDYRYKADVTLPPVTLSGSHGYSKSADSYYTFGASGGATYHHFELCFRAKYLDDATVIYPKSWK